MEITRQSPLTGQFNTVDLPITEEQYALWKQGEPIQEVMPLLPLKWMEFLISGVFPGEWDLLFPNE